MAADKHLERAYLARGSKVPEVSVDHSLRGLQKVLYDAVGQLSSDLSEEAISTLCDDAKSLELNPITLRFRTTGIEAAFQHHVALRRRPTLVLVFCFDVTCYLFRMATKYAKTGIALHSLIKGMMPQICNTIFLYTFLWFLNRRSRYNGQAAAQQEELLLTGIMTLAICSLLATITATNPQDYVYAAMFLISTTCFLKIQWLVGTVFMILPLIVTRYWHSQSDVLPSDAETHLVVSWAVGGFMAYLSDTYRRQMFVNHRLARIAASKELQEAQARINVQQQLATAQQQAAQRTITVAREKAANEAKSEFMSLMCHEVRTPLNGCLASAEMLLEMPLQEEQRELAKTIRVSGSILLSTVSNFLDFFKMEAGKQLDVVRTEMNTQDLVGDIHCIIEATIGRSSDVVLDKPNTSGVPKYVLGDPDRLRGILLNLYTNAAKFTKKGSIALRVRVAGRDHTPSPAQVLAQQQRGPHPLRQGSSKQTSDDAGKQTVKQHRVLFAQDRHGPDSSASPFLSNALAIPHLSHSASAIRSQAQQQSKAQIHNRHRRVQDPMSVFSVAHAGSAADQPTSLDKSEFHAQTLLQRGQQALDLADKQLQHKNITTPVSCEHIAGQAFLDSTAEKIAHAANSLRNGHHNSPQQSDSKAQSQKDEHSQLQNGAGHPQSASKAAPRSSESASSLSTVDESEQLTGHYLVQDAKDNYDRISSNCVLDDQGTSSSFSSSDNVLPSSSELMPSTGQNEAQSASHSGSQKNGTHQQATSSYTNTDAVHVPSPSHDSNNSRASQGGTQEQPTSSQTSDDTVHMPSLSHDTNTSTPHNSGLGERSHSSTDMTEHRHRQSSGSFSGYPQPMRRSLSSPDMNSFADNSSSEHNKPNRLPTAAAYNGTASNKASLGGGIVTSVRDLGNGWHNTVAQRKPCRFAASDGDEQTDLSTSFDMKAPAGSPFEAASAEAMESSCDEWLVFEVTDTGCGISKQGLASLFTEYVQGTEDDMKRPRTRGGTGLGLSICSKQVSVLGGLIGAMSKLGEGSTFWFTVPLLRPPNVARESMSMRRTASWGSRNAFSDGHLSGNVDHQETPSGRRTQTATTRAHRSKRYHTKTPLQRPLRSSFSDTDADPIFSHPHARDPPSDAAARRRSAPEAPANRGGHQGPNSLVAATSGDSIVSDYAAGQPTSHARAALAKAVLSQPPSASVTVTDRMHSDIEHWSNQAERSRNGSGEHRSADVTSAPSPPSKSESVRQPEGHASLSYANIQRNLLMPYEAAPDPRRRTPPADPPGRPSLMALPEEAPVEYEVPSQRLEALSRSRNSSPGTKSAAGPSSAERGMNVRPSMEARRRRLGSFALQGRSVLLAEDNLINQRVAKMMLCSLGMTVEVASNGQEAVQAVCSNAEAVRRNACRQFDVLLMDMAMPVMGGVDATKEIRRRGHAVPIVAMTANASDKDRDECLGAGMDGFLSKPVLKDRLAEAILSAVSGRRQRQDCGTISLKAYDQF